MTFKSWLIGAGIWVHCPLVRPGETTKKGECRCRNPDETWSCSPDDTFERNSFFVSGKCLKRCENGNFFAVFGCYLTKQQKIQLLDVLSWGFGKSKEPPEAHGIHRPSLLMMELAALRRNKKNVSPVDGPLVAVGFPVVLHGLCWWNRWLLGISTKSRCGLKGLRMKYWIFRMGIRKMLH